MKKPFSQFNIDYALINSDKSKTGRAFTKQLCYLVKKDNPLFS